LMGGRVILGAAVFSGVCVFSSLPALPKQKIAAAPTSCRGSF
jgi:hypothetical protein